MLRTKWSGSYRFSIPLPIISSGPRFPFMLMAFALFAIPPAQAADSHEKAAAKSSFTRLPFEETAPMPGALAVSADGHTAVHIAANHDVILWDTAKFKQLKVIPSEGKKPSAVALSPDGSLLAIGYFESKGVVIRSLRERKIVRTLKGPNGISALAFSPDGRLLASGGDDAITQVWELSSGKRLHVFDSQFSEGGVGHGGIPVSLGFSGNGKVLAVNEWYSRFYDVGRGTTLWDIEEGIEISTRDVAPPNSDNTMRAGQALGGRGWLLVYTGGWLADKHGLMAERLDRCEPPQQMPSGGYAETVAADPHGRWVAAASETTLTFIGMDDQQKSLDVGLPAKAVTLAPSADGRYIFALVVEAVHINGNEHFIAGRDAETVTRGALYRLSVPASLLRLPPIEVKADATHCAPTEAVRKAQNFKLPDNPAQLQIAARLVLPRKMVADVVENPNTKITQTIDPPSELYFSLDGKLYALYRYDQHLSGLKSGVAVWNPQTRRLIRAHFEKGIEQTFRKKDGWGACSSNILFDFGTGKTLHWQNEGKYTCSTPIAFDKDTGDVFWSAEEVVEHYSPIGKRLPDMKTKEQVFALSARNGRLAMFYGNPDHDINMQMWQKGKTGTQIYQSVTGTQWRDWGIESGLAQGLALSADGRYLQVPLSGVDNPMHYPIFDLKKSKQLADSPLLAPFPARSNRGVVPDDRPYHLAVWDFDKEEVIAHLPRQENRDPNDRYRTLVAAISDDGRLVASGSLDGLVRVWDIDARQLVGEAKLGGEVTALAFDAEAKQLAAGRADTQLFVLQVPGSAKIGEGANSGVPQLPAPKSD